MISNAKTINLEHQQLWLLPEKAIYWQKRNILIAADLHIGKSGHFRKNGIAIPEEVNKTNLETLSKLLKKTGAEHLIILGDLFHSDINTEWRQFEQWRKGYRQLEVSLVLGNHDILDKQNYHAIHINLFKRMSVDPFLLVHDIDELQSGKKIQDYILCGHIHPAVQLRGKARQSMKLACFYFGEDYGILPAFGAFTGTHIIKPGNKDRIFMIADSQVLPAQQKME